MTSVKSLLREVAEGGGTTEGHRQPEKWGQYRRERSFLHMQTSIVVWNLRFPRTNLQRLPKDSE